MIQALIIFGVSLIYTGYVLIIINMTVDLKYGLILAIFLILGPLTLLLAAVFENPEKLEKLAQIFMAL